MGVILEQQTWYRWIKATGGKLLGLRANMGLEKQGQIGTFRRVFENVNRLHSE